MKLTELNPGFLNAGGEGVSQPSDQPCRTCGGVGCGACHSTGKEYEPAPLRTGVGVQFDCPCGKCGMPCYVPFNNPLDDKGRYEKERPYWDRTGETFETLTLRPSILQTPDKGGCGWHGFITDGEVVGV